MNVGEVRSANESDFNLLYHLATDEPETQNWTLAAKKSHCTVYTKDANNVEFRMILVKAELNDVTAETVYNMLHDSDYRRVWDRNMVDGCEVCVLDANNDIGYYQVKSPGPLKNRDFVTQRSWTVRPDCMIIMNHSVFHKKMPPRKNIIRGVSYCTGNVIQPTSEKSCTLSYITQSDLRGTFPLWLVNRVVTVVAPKVINRVIKAARAYPKWKKSNRPDYLPWKWPDQMTGELIDWDDVTDTGFESTLPSNTSADDLEGFSNGDMLMNGDSDEDED